MGQLNSENLIHAISNPATVITGKYAWTITDVQIFEQDGNIVYVFGKLSKFNPEGIVKVVNEAEKTETNVIEPNLIEASSSLSSID